MSIIQAKATRGTGKPDAPSRDLYEDKTTNRVSQIPFYVGASLGALILYLKNSLVPTADAHGVDEAEQQQSSKHHRAVHETQASPVELHDADLKKICLPGTVDTADNTTPHLPKKGFYSPEFQLHSVNLGNMHFDSLDAAYAGPPEGNLRGLGFSGGFPAIPGNDNRLGGAPSVSSGGGTGTPPRTPSTPTTVNDASPITKPTTPTTPAKPNLAPVVTGFVSLPDVFICDVLTIFVADLLKNAMDPNGDALSVTNVKINGTALTLTGDHYTYDGNDVGFVTVTYNVTDGKLSTADSALVDFLPRPAILGTDGIDNLVGTDCGDNISAGAGNDNITGNAGDDVIYAGSGDDIVTGDAGNDVIYGGDGNDKLYGGDGNDTIFGGNGDDTIYGGSGNNFLFGGSGNDIIYAGDGNNTAFGGSGRDWIFDGAGKDNIFGGIGNDTVFASADGASDYFDGGTGVNKLSYAGFTGNLNINLNTGIATSTGGGIGIGADHFSNFQVIEGGAGGTVFIAKITPIPTVTQTAVTPPTPTAPVDHHDDKPLVVAAGTTDTNPHQDPTPQVAPLPPQDDHSTTSNSTDTTHADTGIVTVVCNDPQIVAMPPDHHEVTVADLPDAAANQGYTYLGGAGVDTLDYSPAQQALTIDVVHGMAQGVEIGTDYFSSIERFMTGAGDDTFIGAGTGPAHHMTVTDEADIPDSSAGPVVAATGPGNDNLLVLDDKSGDTVSGAAANQFFDGGAGFNTLNYSKAGHTIDINVATGAATGDDIGHDTFANIQHFVGGSGSDHFTIGSGTFVLDGHGGGDTFTFLAADSGSTNHTQISGFEVGDVIQASKFDIFEAPEKSQEDQFQKIYAGSENDQATSTVQDAVVPIRVRHEVIHDVQKTFVDANIDDHGSYLTCIELDGNHHLVVNTHIV